MVIPPAARRAPLRLAVAMVLLAMAGGPARAQPTLRPHTGGTPNARPAATARPVTARPVTTGAQRLVDTGFAALDGLTVGLIANPTSRVDTADGGPAYLLDRLAAAPNVRLGALFAPEHGLRGTAEAGARVASGRDPVTGVPVHSLYGAAKKPTRAQLAGLDALVFDVQDVGARFYTYVSTMGLAMEAAAEAGLPFVVLDRPNPVGGRVEGWLREAAHASFVGPYPVPVTPGMTVGELARMIAGEGWIAGADRLDLRVVEMEGWTRATPWPATGLAWTPPSPNVPDVETALVYAGTALIEGTSASEGRGTDAPFLTVGAPWADADALAAALNARGLPGVRFAPATFTPRDLPGRATNPKHEGRRVRGVRLAVTDVAAFRPVETGVHVLHALYGQAPAAERARFAQRDWLAKLAGTDRLRRMLAAGATAEAIAASWAADAAAFTTRRAPYLLYD